MSDSCRQGQYRNRIKSDLLNWLMMISMNAPNDLKKFNYDAAVEYWATRWRHRVDVRSSRAAAVQVSHQAIEASAAEKSLKSLFSDD